MSPHTMNSISFAVRGLVCISAFALLGSAPASAQEAKRIPVALLPLQAAKGTDASFAQMSTNEIRSFLGKATWLSLIETDRVDRVLAEIAKSHTLDYDREQELDAGRRLEAAWVCSGTVEVYIYQSEPKDPLSWHSTAVVTLQATSVSSGEVRRLEGPLRHSMLGLRADGARRQAADCARTVGQMAGDEISKWIVPMGSVIETDGKRCLVDLGSEHGITPKLKVVVSYVEANDSGKEKAKTAKVTLDQVGTETAGGKIPGRASIRVGDRVTLAPELRSASGSGLSSFMRQMASAAASNPNALGAVGDTAQPAYTGPPIQTGKSPELHAEPGGGGGGGGGGGDTPWLIEIPFQAGDDLDLGAALPGGVAFTSGGEMIVTDATKHKLLFYDTNGLMQRELTFEGLAGGIPRSPHGIAIDRRGAVYFAEHSGCRIFKVEGDRASVFADCPGGAKDCGYLPGVAVDAAGSVYAAGWNGRVIKFSPSGAVEATWDSIPGDARRNMMWSNSVSMCPDGNIAVLDDHGPRIIRFTPQGLVVQVVSLKASESDRSRTHDTIVVDRKGYSWVLAQFGSDLVVVSPDGRVASPVNRILPGKVRPDAIGLDAQGNLCVRDSEEIKFRKYRIEHGELSFAQK